MNRIVLRIVTLSLTMGVGFLGNPALAIVKSKAEVPARTDDKAEAPPALQQFTGSNNRIFDDAVALKAMIAQGASQSANIKAMLSAYGVDPAMISHAPFLNKVSYFNQKSFAEAIKPPPGGLATPQGAAPSGLFSASSVADALGSLIAERFKQEVEMEALRNLAQLMVKISDDVAGKALSAGMPKSVAYLKTLVDPATKKVRPLDQNDWAVMQSTFRVDVAALPGNIPAFLDALYANSPNIEARYLTWIASTTGVQVIKNGRNPYGVIDAVVSSSDAFKNAHKTIDDGRANPVIEFDTGIRVTAILSHMLTKNAQFSWRSARELSDFLRLPNCVNSGDCDGFYLLLGLSYARDTSLYSDVDQWLNSRGMPVLEAAASDADLKKLMGKLDQVLASLERVSQDVQGIPNPITSIVDAGPLVSELGPLAVSMCAAIGTFKNLCADTTEIRLTDAAKEVSAVVDTIGDIKSKEYAAAIGELIAYIDAYQAKHGVDPSGQIRDFLRDSGPFIAAVAAAKTSADLTAALENYALPAGSYTQQQQRKFSATLNSFFGVALGAETLIGGLADTHTARTRTHLGFAAPVGIEFNWGQVTDKSPANGRFFETGAWSAFVPVLDVGAVASWRLGSGGGSVSAITWQNIVAPGLYVVWSKRDSPLSILFGAQYGPELRKVSTGGGTTIQRAALQFPSLEFTFNIPIFNLYR